MAEDPQLPAPTAISRSIWATSPSSLGAYSYSRAGFGPARPNLQNLYIPGLFFAGEALSVDLYGTIEAAYVTAEAAAKKCLRSLP